MTTITGELVTYQDLVDLTEHVTIAGFLAGYTGKHRPGAVSPPPMLRGWCRLGDSSTAGCLIAADSLAQTCPAAGGELR